MAARWSQPAGMERLSCGIPSQLRFGGLKAEFDDLQQSEINALAISNDGSRIAAGGNSDTIRLWDVANPEEAPDELTAEDGAIGSLAFSPDGSLLAGGGSSAQISVWDLSRIDEPPLRIPGHKNWISSLAFSPDGTLLASGSSDTTIRLWDSTDWEAEPQILEGHQDAVQSVAFSRNGQLLASGSSDSSVRLWRVAERDLLAFACARVGRNLSWPEADRYLITEDYHVSCPDLPIHPSVAAELSAKDEDERGPLMKALLAKLWGESPPAAHVLTGQLPAALIAQAITLAGQGQYEEAQILIDEARQIDEEVDLAAVGSAMADGWDRWRSADLNAEILDFSAELEKEYPKVAAEFMSYIPKVMIGRAISMIEEGNARSDEEAIALIANAQALDPQVDTTDLGIEIASAWQIRYWETEDHQQQITEIASALEGLSLPEAAEFRYAMADFLYWQAVNIAWEGNEPAILELLGDAYALESKADFPDVAEVLAEVYPWVRALNRCSRS